MALKFYKIFQISVLALFVLSCRPHPLTNEAPLVNEVKIGQKFSINLPEDHTTGYTWQLKNGCIDPKIIQELNAVWHGNTKGIDFNFKCLAPGQSTLTFVQRKYIDTLNVKSFIVKNTRD